MRSWLGLCAVGAGVEHLGVAATAPPALLAALALIGAAEVVWGVVVLAVPAPPRPRAALAGAVLPIVLWLVVLVGPMEAHATGQRVPEPLLPMGAMAGAGLLDLTLAALLAVLLRRPTRTTTGEQPPARFLLTTAPAAALVAIVVANSLSATALGAGMVMH